MRVSRTFVAYGALATALAFAAPSLYVRVSGQAYVPSAAKGDWVTYTSDVKGSRYSPLDQINESNFNQLEVAWRFKTDNLGTRPEFKLEGTPLAINGVIYATGGTRRSVVALDGKTGELRWVYSLREGARAVAAPRQLSGRGLSYWTDGKGDNRVIFVTTGYNLVSLNAQTGQPIKTFGKDGIVDMKVGAVVGKGEQINLETGEIGLHSTPTVAKDVILRLVVPRGPHGQDAQQHEGPRARVGRQDGPAALDVQHDSASRRIRQRHVGKRIVGGQRQHGRVVANHRR